MTGLVLERKRDGVGVFRRVKVTVDGEVVARLRPGARVEVDVTPGPHRVQAHMDWISSEEVQVAPERDERPTVLVAYGFSGSLAMFRRVRTEISIGVCSPPS